MMVLLRNKCIFCGGGDTQTLLAVKFLFELYAHSRCGNAKMKTIRKAVTHLVLVVMGNY